MTFSSQASLCYSSMLFSLLGNVTLIVSACLRPRLLQVSRGQLYAYYPSCFPVILAPLQSRCRFEGRGHLRPRPKATSVMVSSLREKILLVYCKSGPK